MATTTTSTDDTKKIDIATNYFTLCHYKTRNGCTKTDLQAQKERSVDGTQEETQSASFKCLCQKRTAMKIDNAELSFMCLCLRLHCFTVEVKKEKNGNATKFACCFISVHINCVPFSVSAESSKSICRFFDGTLHVMLQQSSSLCHRLSIPHEICKSCIK